MYILIFFFWIPEKRRDRGRTLESLKESLQAEKKSDERMDITESRDDERDEEEVIDNYWFIDCFGYLNLSKQFSSVEFSS